jgi:hypothetical protein
MTEPEAAHNECRDAAGDSRPGWMRRRPVQDALVRIFSWVTIQDGVDRARRAAPLDQGPSSLT